MKEVFIIILVASSAMLGNALARSGDEKEKIYREFLVCLKCMRAGMLYQGMSVYEAFMHAENAGLNGYFGECAGVMKGNHALKGRDIIAMSGKSMDLPADISELLGELCDMVCTAVTKSDVEDAFSMVNKRAVDMLRERSEAGAKRGKLAKSLCFAGGLVLAIVIA